MQRWYYLLLSNVICLGIVLIIPSESLILRTFGAVIPAVVGIWVYIFLKYGKYPPLQVEVLMSVGVTVQFLLPSLYLCSITAPPEYLASSLQYLDYYPDVAYAALLGQSLFFIGYQLFDGKIERRYEDSEITSPLMFIQIFFPFIAAVWLSRIIILATGSYYTIGAQSDFMYKNPWHSIIAQISYTGFVIIGGIWILAWKSMKKGMGKLWLQSALIISIVELAWYLPSGGREPVLAAGVAIIFSYIFVEKKIPYKWIAIGACISTIIVTGMDFYHYSIGGIASKVDTVRLDEIREAVSVSQHGFLEEWISGEWLIRAISRLADARSVAVILEGVPKKVQYLKGDTYLKIPFIFVPRFLYPDKPAAILAINEWFLQNEGGSSPTTLIGEAYLNFGWLGIFFVMPIMGIISIIYDKTFEKHLNDTVWSAVYVGFAVTIVRLHVQPVAIWLGVFMKAVILAIILRLWQRIIVLKRTAPHIKG